MYEEFIFFLFSSLFLLLFYEAYDLQIQSFKTEKATYSYLKTDVTAFTASVKSNIT